MNYLFVIGMIMCFMMGLLSVSIAKKRNRNPLNWFLIGFMFGLFGVLLLLLLPPLAKESKSRENVRVPDIKTPHAEAAAIPEGPLYPNPITLRVSRDSSLDWYFIDRHLHIIGPLKLNDLRKTLIESKLDNKTYIWCEEFPDWTPIYQLQNGASLLDPDFL